MDIDDDLSPVKMTPKMSQSDFEASLTEHAGVSSGAVQKLVGFSSAKELLRSTANGLFDTIVDAEYNEPDKKRLKMFVFAEAGKLAEMRREQSRAKSNAAMVALADKAASAAASAAAAAAAANSVSATAGKSEVPAPVRGTIAFAD